VTLFETTPTADGISETFVLENIVRVHWSPARKRMIASAVVYSLTEGNICVCGPDVARLRQALNQFAAQQNGRNRP
jgi:hypothetical protein